MNEEEKQRNLENIKQIMLAIKAAYKNNQETITIKLKHPYKPDHKMLKEVSVHNNLFYNCIHFDRERSVITYVMTPVFESNQKLKTLNIRGNKK